MRLQFSLASAEISLDFDVTWSGTCC